MVSVIVMGIVFILISLRQQLGLKMQIWQIMCAGALAVLLTGEIGPLAAFQSINSDVMLFLLGMFIVGQGLEESGYLSYLTFQACKRARNTSQLLHLILVGGGLLSAVLMNDTMVIIGTPVILSLARQHGIPARPLLLALAFAVTIGSTMSPIGNPQNLLIAIGGGIDAPFLTFFRYLLVPTVINIYLALFWLKLLFRQELANRELIHRQQPVKDQRLAALSRISLILIVLLVLLRVVITQISPGIEFRLTYIALIAALPVILFNPRRWVVTRQVDWYSLLFFVGMFILMQSVWLTGFWQSALVKLNTDITSMPVILIGSVLLSQLFSNVPVVALYLPLLLQAGSSVQGLLALAAGSTIAGNLLILGAASNIIIIQYAERNAGETLTLKDFMRAGAPLTVINLLVYYIFLKLA